MKRLADWDPAHTREPLLLAATASYIGEGFDCPALDTLFLCSPSSSESIITQNVGRIMRDLPGKTTAEVHDGGEMAEPRPPLPAPTSAGPRKPGRVIPVSASQVWAWAKEHGIDVADRGRLRPEIWEQYHAAHPA